MTRPARKPPVRVPSAGAVLHYAEIGTKGANRVQFERRLEDRLREALGHAGLLGKVIRLGGRFLAVPREGATAGEALEVLLRVPGVASGAPAQVVPAALEATAQAAVDLLGAQPAGTFKVESRRTDKAFAVPSMEVSRQVGASCRAASGRDVDVHAPAVTVRIEVLAGCAVVSAGERPGPGGLPVGSSGHLLALLSGGLDSPVAAWQVLRRGARVTAVHFWNRTARSQAVLEKLEDLARVLARTAGEVPLVVVPFEGCQSAIVAGVTEPLRMLVYRRAMLRAGAALARSERAQGLVTGDCLGPVASQTAENLRAVHAVLASEGLAVPVYMPLVGSDKAEIVARARALGTYDISIRPHEDQCSLLATQRPAKAAQPDDLARAEAGLPWAGLVQEALAGARRTRVRPA
ncbi:MAG: tRNA uracil 4-sulfurtransferase ThiI [Planctomycetia bacterium]